MPHGPVHFNLFTDPPQERPDDPEPRQVGPSRELLEALRRIRELDIGAFAPAVGGTEPPNLISTTQATSNNLTAQLLAGSQYMPPQLPVPGMSVAGVPDELTPPPPEEMGAIDALTNGLGKGMLMVNVGVGTAAESLGEFTANSFGSPQWAETLDAWGEEFREQSMRGMEILASRNDAAFLTPNWMLDVVGSAAPLMVTAAGAAAASGAAATAAGMGGLATAAIGLLGASATMYPTEKGFLEEELKEAGLSDEKADAYSSLGAIPIALAESFMEATSMVGGRVVTPAVRSVFKNKLVRLAGGAFLEGVTEAAQEEINMQIVGGVTGEEAENRTQRLVESFAAGMVAGGVFQGVHMGAEAAINSTQQQAQEVFTDVSGLDETLSTELVEALNEGVREITAAEVDTGTTVAGKTKDASGRWRDETGSFTKAPTTEEVTNHVKDAANEGEAVAATETLNNPAKPTEINISDAASIVASIHEDRTAEVAEINARYLSASYRSSAMQDAQNLTEAEINHKMATLENIAIDQTNGVDYPTRIRALANIRALESALQKQRASDTPVTQVDTSVGAKSLESMDDEAFTMLKTVAEQSSDPLARKVYREAEIFRMNSANLEQGNANDLRKRLDTAKRNTARGLSSGSTIVTPDGQVGEVVSVRKSGFLDVQVEGQEGMQVVNPASVTIVPTAGQLAKVQGEVLEVIEVNEDSALARNTEEADIVIDLSQIESISFVPDETASLAAQRESRQAPVPEEAVQLPETTEVVNKNTGQTEEVVAISENEVTTSTGKTLPRSQVSSVTDDQSRVVSQVDKIPTFKAGTNPAEGKHINFVQIPEGMTSLLERSVADNNIRQISSLLSDNNFTLFPQPDRDGYITFAVEMPGNARELTAGSKKALSFLSGKTNSTPSIRSKVKAIFTVPEGAFANIADELSIMWVPPALLNNVSHKGFKERTKNEQREYLRRLTNLSFYTVSPETQQAIKEASDAFKDARDKRISGDIGGAEVAEIEAMAARAEAAQRLLEEDLADRKRMWEEAKTMLRDAMSPTELRTVDFLNMSTREELLRIRNVGPKVADRIIKQRKRQGFTEDNFTSELLNLKGVGEPTIAKIMSAVRGGDVSIANISDSRDENLIKFLVEMPGRTGSKDVTNWIPAFNHPHIPGMRMIIDKEVIMRATSATGGVRRTREEVIEEFGEAAAQFPEEVLERLEGGRNAAEGTAYHISYVTPEGNVVKARTIISGEQSFRLPISAVRRQIDDRGFSTPGPAELELTKAAAEGGDLREIANKYRDRRKNVDQVRLEGEEGFLDVIDKVRTGGREGVPSEETGQLIVEDNDGNRFEVEALQVVETRRDREGDGTVRIPIPYTPEEQAAEVVSMVRGFDKAVKFFTVGEYRSQIPNVYAEIRPWTGQGQRAKYRVMMMESSEGRVMDTMKLYESSFMKDFESLNEAKAFLSDRGFVRYKDSDIVAEIFSTLPPVEELDAIGMQISHDQMTDVLDSFVVRGYIPQPVRDYAVRLAIRMEDYSKEKGVRLHQRGGYFGSRKVRKALNLFTHGDLMSAVDTGQGSPRSTLERLQTVEPSGKVYYQDGKILKEYPTPAQASDDVRVMDGILLSDSVEWTNPAKIETAKALYRQHEHRQRFLDMVPGDSSPESNIQDRLVKIGKDKRLGVVLQSMPGTNRLLVQFFREGQPVVAEVRKEDVTPERSPEKLNDYIRTTKDILGELTNLPTTPTIGTSPLDKIMGLDGITDRAAYADGLREFVVKVLQRMPVHPDGTITGDTDLLVPLRDAYIRMRELEIPNRVGYAEELDPDGMYDFFEIYGETHRRMVRLDEKPLKSDDPLIPSALMVWREGSLGLSGLGVIPEMAYQEIAAGYSNVSAFGDIMAKAKLGQLTKGTQKQILEGAERFGIDTEQPFYKVVEDLMQNVWDPDIANTLFADRRKIDVLSFASGLGVNFKHGVEIRMPVESLPVFQSGIEASITFPREVAKRHPTARLFINKIEKDRITHVNEVKAPEPIYINAQNWSIDQKRAIESLWESPEIGDAMDRPVDILSEERIREVAPELAARADAQNIPGGWYAEYVKTREMLNHLRKRNIRNGLFRGYHAEEYTFQSEDEMKKLEELEELYKQNNLTKDEYDAMASHVKRGGKAYTLDRVSNPAYRHPDSEIDVFLDLTDKYKALSEIPESVQQGMKDWMLDEFDFWARYGIKNYAPSVLQGRHKIKMIEPNGNEVTVATTPDGQSAHKFFLDVSLGRVPGIPQDAEMFIEIGKAIVDDMDQHYLGSDGFGKFYSQMVKMYGGKDGEGTKLARAAVKALNLGSERAAPRDLHLQARTSDLMSIIEDPYRKLKIYNDRTSRNNFLLNVNHAYHMAEKHDLPLSISHGVEPAFSNQEAKVSGQPLLRNYLRDLRDNAMGMPTQREKNLSHLVALTSFDILSVPGIFKKIKDPNYRLLRDPEVFPMMYAEDYALRETARKWNTFQSYLRLGANIGGSLINSMQSMMMTPSYLMHRGFGAGESMKYMYEGYQEAIKYTLSPKSQRSEELNLYFEAIGIGSDAITGAAVPGLNVGNNFSSLPPKFTDDKPLKRFGDMSAFLLMMPFSSAEQVTRRAAGIAAKKAAEARGLHRSGSITNGVSENVALFARDLIDNTQFQYYDQALPPFMRGPLARILFQFAHFQANAIKYEKDLFVGSGFLPKAIAPRTGTFQGQSNILGPTGDLIPASKGARKALLYHLGVIGMTGGLAAIAQRPILAPLNWLIKYFTDYDDIEQLIALSDGRAEDKLAEQIGTNIGDPELFKAINFIKYGLGGLFDLQLSQRVGVSGLDINPSRLWDVALGPSVGGLYGDVSKGFFGEQGFAKVNPQATFAGVAAGSFINSAIRRSPAAMIPHTFAGFSILSSAVLSNQGVGNMSFESFTDTETGKRFRSAMLPTVAEAAEFTYDVFNNNEVSDRSLYSRNYGTTFNKAFESGTRVLGFQTIRTAEERALMSRMRNSNQSYANMKNMYVQAIATAQLEYPGGLGSSIENPEVVELYNAATQLNIEITEEDIIREINRREQKPVADAEARTSAGSRRSGN